VVGGVGGDPAASETGLVRPVLGRLGLPGPHDPALAVVLVNLGLGVVELAKEGLVVAGPSAGAARQAVAGVDVVRAGVRAVHTGAEATAVDPLSTVARGEGPLADDEPERRRGVVASLGADTLKVRQ
jgi:hypothetical protein